MQRQIVRPRTRRRKRSASWRKGIAELGRPCSYPKWAEDMRPLTRADCIRGPRPCPWVSCRYHLYLDYYPRYKKIRLNFPNLHVWEMRETCALDVADLGHKQLQAVGDVLGITRERVRQIEVAAILKLRKRLPPDILEELIPADVDPAIFDAHCACL